MRSPYDSFFALHTQLRTIVMIRRAGSVRKFQNHRNKALDSADSNGTIQFRTLVLDAASAKERLIRTMIVWRRQLCWRRTRGCFLGAGGVRLRQLDCGWGGSRKSVV